MKPIRKALLVNTITIFNHYKNDDGDTLYIPSVINQCLCYDKKNFLSVNNYGVSKQYNLRVILDNKNTFVKGKQYIDYTEWQELSEEEKKLYWTLQVDDILIKKEIIVEDIEEYKGEKFVLKEKVNYQDKDGSIHSREIICI